MIIPDASVRDKLVRLRRDLHRYPELAFEEERTAARLTEELATLEPAELSRVAGTGVIARIKGTDPDAPVVVVRGDIDALPIQEDTGLDFASENPGVMHACGHDVHATWAVGAAYLLEARPARGDVLILLQPGEESGKGALAVLETGVLDEASAIFGAHVDRRFPVGQVVAQTGSLAAAADEFRIELRGRSCHAARPQEGVDPTPAAGALIEALHSIVPRRLSPANPAVVSIGILNAGTASNIIPDSVRIQGTLRSMEPETQQLLRDEVRGRAEGIAAAYGLEARASFDVGLPPVINRAEAVEWARQAVSTVLGDDALVPLGYTNMAGEDFGCYLEKMTGCFLRMGAREVDGEFIPVHTPGFVAADESIFVGAAVLAETARVASSGLARH